MFDLETGRGVLFWVAYRAAGMDRVTQAQRHRLLCFSFLLRFSYVGVGITIRGLAKGSENRRRLDLGMSPPVR